MGMLSHMALGAIKGGADTYLEISKEERKEKRDVKTEIRRENLLDIREKRLAKRRTEETAETREYQEGRDQSKQMMASEQAGLDRDFKAKEGMLTRGAAVEAAKAAADRKAPTVTSTYDDQGNLHQKTWKSGQEIDSMVGFKPGKNGKNGKGSGKSSKQVYRFNDGGEMSHSDVMSEYNAEVRRLTNDLTLLDQATPTLPEFLKNKGFMSFKNALEQPQSRYRKPTKDEMSSPENFRAYLSKETDLTGRQIFEVMNAQYGEKNTGRTLPAAVSTQTVNEIPLMGVGYKGSKAEPASEVDSSSNNVVINKTSGGHDLAYWQSVIKKRGSGLAYVSSRSQAKRHIEILSR